MRLTARAVGLVVVLGLAIRASDAAEAVAAPTALRNPISEDYLRKHLSSAQPRLVYTPEIVERLKGAVETDPVVKNLYGAIRLNAAEIQKRPLLKRKMVGRRLLRTSREMLYRVNMLGVVVLVDEDEAALRRLNEELLAVCGFSDWNPSHFLDVAEMSLAVALALDWAGERLPEPTIKQAKTALIEKGIAPSWPKDGKRWSRAYGDNNWNQVCNGGLIAAALVVADQEPELAAKTIHRSLEGMPNALRQYAPDGVYPEGSTYWSYGTSFTVVTAAMLESALGSDFGLYDTPGLKESAVFRSLSVAPSELYYNFADCGDSRGKNGDTVLAWFAMKSGNAIFFEKERFSRPAREMGELGRLDGAALAWITRFEPTRIEAPPSAWKGDGANPIVIFKSDASDPRGYYFGGKGGRATSSHGNMDAGSFVFELNGVRWVLDLGNQSYHDLEKRGFDLWGRKQESPRWTLLTKNNFGHSALTVNKAPFIVDGFATLAEFSSGSTPSATFDLTAVYGSNVERATRLFLKDGPASLVVEDRIVVSEKTHSVTWQLMTIADVEPVEGGALMRQDGKTLRLILRSHPDLAVEVVSLDPPPMKLDRRVKGLKRIEIKVPVVASAGGDIAFNVRLAEGED